MIKFSDVKGYKPTQHQLMQSDILVNTADKKIYAKDTRNQVVPIGGSGTIDSYEDVYGAIQSYNENTDDGLLNFTWVKYADDDQGTNMTDDPTGKSWMGMAYNRVSATESDDYTDYAWSYLGGVDGTDGEDGKDGLDGSDGTGGNFFFTAGSTTGSWDSTLAYNTVNNALGFVPNYAVVTIYQIADPTISNTRYYLNGLWLASSFHIHGALTVDGTIISQHLATGTVTATKMDLTSFGNWDGYNPNNYAITIDNTKGGVSVIVGEGYYGFRATGGYFGIHCSAATQTAGYFTGARGVYASGSAGHGVNSISSNALYAGGYYNHTGGGNALKSIKNVHFTSNLTVDGTFTNFTGAHFAFTEEVLTVGDIVSVVNVTKLNISETYSVVDKSVNTQDPSIFGVVSSIEADTQAKLQLLWQDDENPVDKEKSKIKNKYKTVYDSVIFEDYTMMTVNALGEGGINVCAENGDINNGDYICSGYTSGKGRKQDDDILHNYTVAKAIESVDWSKETDGVNGCFLFEGVLCKMIACTYHCG